MNVLKTLGIIILILVVISAILIGIFGWPFGDTQNEPVDLSTDPIEETMEDQSENEDIRTADPLSTEETVTYDGTGFSPQTLEISEGTTVTWVNESNQQMWIATDDHPVHDQLPSFDAGEEIDSGENYTYTFDQLGEWTYHNHLAPSQTGTILVLPVK